MTATAWKKLYIRKNCDLPTFCGVELTAYTEIWKQTGQHKEYLFAHFKDKHFTYYLNGLNELEIGRKLYKKYFRNEKQIIKAYADGLLFLKTTKKKTEKWRAEIKKNPSIQNLQHAYTDFTKDFSTVNVKYSISPWWALEAWQYDFEEIIKELVRKNGLQPEFETIINSLLKSWKKTALHKAGDELANGSNIHTLVNKYQFLRSWTVVWNKPIGSDWIKSTATVNKKNHYLSQTALIRLLKPSSKQIAFIKLAPYIVFFKDWRDDLRRQQAYDWSFFFDKLAKHFKMSRADLGYYTLDELASALKDDFLNKETLKQRKGKEFILTNRSKQLTLEVLVGVPQTYQDIIKKISQKKELSMVRGIVAQTGFVKGEVRIVHNIHDIKKFAVGEILVANTTHPNYLQGMKKAAAFITDEGGIASHAAIVARELKIPCIVGTKVATKVFKDGDMVEVDANKGIIRKL